MSPGAPDDEIRESLSAGEQVFETWRKRAGIVAAPVAFAITFTLCDGLTPEGRRLAAILAGVGVLWVCETIPLPATALLGALLCIVLKVADAKKVFAYFGDPIVFVFIGSFILARAMSVHALDRRIALAFLSMPGIGASPAGMLLGMGLASAVVSMWVSNTATTAMMLPIGLGMLAAVHRVRSDRGLASGPMDARTWPFATAMMLMIAYAASIGGVGTPVGSPPNLIGIGLIRKNTGIEISFFQWMLLCVPMLALMFVVLFVLLRVLHREKGSVGSSGEMRQFITIERQRLGGWTRGQVNTAIAFATAITLWMLPGFLGLPGLVGGAAEQFFKTRLPEAAVAVLAALLLFLLPTNFRRGEFTLTWPDAARIDWGTILLFGGGLALGNLMFETGVAHAMGDRLTSLLGVNSLWAITALSIALAIVLSEATSNTAAAQMVVPVVIAISQSAGVDPIPPAIGAVLGASFGFMLPVSTPPNAIVYGSGLIPITRMLRAGIFFDVIGFFMILLGMRVLWPLVGIAAGK